MTDREIIVQTLAQLDNICKGLVAHLSGSPVVPPPIITKPPVEPPVEPPARASYINRFEGPVPGNGLWRVSFSSPFDPPAVQEITIPAHWPNATLYCGDPAFAEMAVEVEGVGKISNGTPQCAFPQGPGTYKVSVTCVNSEGTMARGCGPVGIYVRETP